MNGWLARWRKLDSQATRRRPHYIGLIANRTLSGWDNPKWTGWVLSEEGFSGKMILEPARVRSPLTSSL